MSEKEAQQKYIELQLLSNQIKQVQQQISALEQQTIELANLKDNLSDISKVKPGAEILVPIGSSIFLKAELKDTQEVIMGVGSNVTVKKDIPSSQKVIEIQITELSLLIIQLETELEHIITEAQERQKELMVLAQQQKKKQ